MRTIKSEEIMIAVKNLCIRANKILPRDVESAVRNFAKVETNPLAKSIMEDLCENIDLAKELDIPVCQDTGMAVVFAEIGQDVHIEGDFNEAVNEGVRQGYTQGYLRASVVADPLNRVNTNDNTPAVIHVKLVSGDKVELMVAPKGFGSENMSALKMFTPSASLEDIKQFVIQTVVKAGGNPCPPVVVGVGIGGDFEMCAYLAKKALCRSFSLRNEKEFYKNLEVELLDDINKTGIGPQGFGGDTTALCVNIETYPTHIAGLPVAVNIGCHVTRHEKIII